MEMSDLENSKNGQAQKNIQEEGDILEKVLEHVGQMGTYQIWLFVAMAPFGFFYAFVYSIQMFIVATPQNHWCAVPDLQHLDLELRRNLSAPGALTGEWDSCYTFQANWSEVLETMMPPDPSTPTERCSDGWDFQFTDIPYQTVVSERGWVCQYSSFVPTAQTISFAGSMIGTLFFGWVADRYGRIVTLVASNLIGCIGGIATIFTTTFWDFALCRFLVGLSYDSCFMMIYILALEYVGPQHRTWVANLSIALYFGGASMMVPWLALWIGDWRMLLVATSTPMLIVIGAPFVIPESTRWLASKGKVDKAVKILKRFEVVNKTHIPKDVMDEFIKKTQKSEEPAESVMELFKSSELRRMIFFMVVVYICVAITFDGLIRVTENLGTDFFITFTISASTELPSLFILTLILDRFGRRLLTAGTIALAGILLFCTLFTPEGIPVMVLTVIARFFANMTYNTMLQWATELLPTPLRASGTSMMHISAFAGNMISPFITYLDRYWSGWPMLIMGVVSLVACAAAVFLPETMGKPLPQTIADGEQLVRDFSLFKKKGKEENLNGSSESQ